MGQLLGSLEIKLVFLPTGRITKAVLSQSIDHIKGYSKSRILDKINILTSYLAKWTFILSALLQLFLDWK